MKLDEILGNASQPSESPQPTATKPSSSVKGVYKLDDILSITAQPQEQPLSVPKVPKENGQVLPMPTTPQYKNWSDLTTKQQAVTGAKRFGYGVETGLATGIASAIESASRGKDYAFGTFKDLANPTTIDFVNSSPTANTTPAYSVTKDGKTRSAKQTELATDTELDKKIKNLATVYSNFGEDTADQVVKAKQDVGLDPKDTIVDQVFQGVGSMLPFVATGYVTKVASTALGLGKYASTIATGANVITESLMEASDAYKSAKANGATDEEAYKTFENVGATNVALIGITDKLGGIFEDTAYKGVKKLFKAGFSGFMEGGQEAVQQMTSNFNTGRPILEGVKDSFIVGALLGTPASYALDFGIDEHLSDKDKEVAKEKIDATDASPENKEIAKAIVDGTATDEQVTQALINTVQKDSFGVVLDADAIKALEADIKDNIEQGFDTAKIANDLVDAGIKMTDATTIIAGVVDKLKTNDLKEVVKQDAQPYIEATKKAEEEMKKKNEQAVREAQQVEMEKQQEKTLKTLSEPRQMAMDEINFYLDDAKAGQRIFIPEATSSDYNVVGVPSSFPSWLPENMRSRKVFDQLKPYWQKQERPSNRTPRLQALYDKFQEHVNKKEADYQKDIDARMSAQKEDVEFKKQAPKRDGGREIEVIKDFQKRYKVNFPTFFVNKIILGEKTKLDPRSADLAEGVTDGNAIAIAYDAIVSTGRHELVHLMLRNLDVFPQLKGITMEDILEAKKQELIKEGRYKKGMNVEEELALDIENYENKSYKPKTTILGKFYQALVDMVQGLRKLIVKSNGDVIRDYYDAILYGKTNRQYEIELENKTKIIKYLIDDVLDYTPHFAQKRTLSISNGITSIDFKTKKPAMREVTGLDQVRINYFASHMDQEDAKVLEDFVLAHDENQQIKPRENEPISKAEVRAIDYFENGLKLPSMKPEKMASISVAILDQYYATTPKVNVWNEQPKFKEAVDKVSEIYKESGDLTTKILKDLEGKRTVSKQYIKDSLKRDGIKQSERALIEDLFIFFGDIVNVKDFAGAVKDELLPLVRKDVGSEYESITLPDDMRGDVAEYSAHVYESPIKTSAGGVHFGNVQDAMGGNEIQNYFGHTRIEDMADKKLRRVIEVQSDLYQKGRLEKEATDYTIQDGDNMKLLDRVERRKKEFNKLSQYNDPTAHFRMIREEIRRASLDGKTKLQFPTGETAMKIEGLGDNTRWWDVSDPNTAHEITTTDLKVGKSVRDGVNDWIITYVFGDGKFKAVQKDAYDEFKENPNAYPLGLDPHTEQFDISGKVDTNNPIYKFYEKEVAKYLKNNYKAETVTDAQGVTWNEIKITPEQKGAVLAFKERVSRQENEDYIKKYYPRYYAVLKSKLAPEKVSRAYERAKSRLRDAFQADVTYTPIRIADQMAKAFEVVKQDPEYAVRVAMGLDMPPLDVTDTAISLAVAETAKEQGNFQQQADAERERSLRQTRRGQEIVMENGRVDENSPEFFIKQVLNRRKELIAQKYRPFMNKAKPFNDVLDEVKSNKVKKNKKIKTDLELKVEDFNSFLEDLAC